MAIVDMKRLRALVPKQDAARLLHFLQNHGCVQITPPEADNKQEADSYLATSRAQTEEALSRIRWAIGKLAKYDKVKQSMFKPLPEVDAVALEDSGAEEAALALVQQVEALFRQTGELRGQETRLKLSIEQLRPWLALDLPAGDIRDTASTRVFTGHAPTAKLGQLIQDWSTRPAVITTLGTQRDETYLYALVYRSQADQFLSDLRAIGFQRAEPTLSVGSPSQQAQALQDEINSLSEDHKNIEAQLDSLGDQLPSLRLAYEGIKARQDRQQAQADLVSTNSFSLLSGWVPAPQAEALKDKMAASFPSTQVLLLDPQEGEEPPVLLHNSGMVAPYESVVSGFSLPAYGSIDPTTVMAPFFACFFGMMVSDAGYGLLMAILIPIMIKLMKPTPGAKKLLWVLAGGGVLTVLWGTLYNTWFGFGPWPVLFDPVNDSLEVMGLGIGIGALHMFAALGIGIYQNFKRGKPLDALYDQVSWMLMVIGLGLLALPQTAEIGKWMAITGAVIVVFTAGREKSKNPIKRLISGLGALYGITGWISDLLSYMRLFGMGLATGVIGMVINMLVKMIMDGSGIIGFVFGAVVFVFAHLFNAAINILGAYVHSARLQYIEFFGKFYEEGGKPFKPLRLSPRYLRFVDKPQ